MRLRCPKAAKARRPSSETRCAAPTGNRIAGAAVRARDGENGGGPDRPRAPQGAPAPAPCGSREVWAEDSQRQASRKALRSVTGAKRLGAGFSDVLGRDWTKAQSLNGVDLQKVELPAWQVVKQPLIVTIER